MGGLGFALNYKEMLYLILYGLEPSPVVKSALGWLLELFGRLLDGPATIFVNLE